MRAFLQALSEFLAAIVRAVQRGLAALGGAGAAVGRGCALGVRAAGRAMARGARLLARAARSRPARAGSAAALTLARTAAWTAVFALLALAAGWFLFQRVPAGFVGVRQANFGAGIQPGDHAPGIYLAPRGLTSWHLVERRTFVLDFAWESEGGDHPPIEVRTRDGNICHLSVSLLYRVQPGAASALVRDGLRLSFHQRVKATTEKIVLEEFGQLTSSEYADTDLRLARCAATLPRLNALFRDYHVQAEALLVTQFLFAMQYEKKLQETQLLAQNALMTEAQRNLERAREELALLEMRIEGVEKRVRAELDTAIQERFAVGRRRIVALEQETREHDRRRKAEAQAEHDRLVAEGERALSRAAGAKDRLANEMYGSEGGRILLAQKAAQNLNLKSVILNANDPRVPNVLDLDALVRLLLGADPRARP
ncbi:MAG: hypothetical protein JNK02_12385 [Planctomycetes bacterium]|nr:hypothetical protein [Planctomycetota bacterium]